MRDKVDPIDLLNIWLKKYHNISFEQVLESHPEWKENPIEHSNEFYDTYPVTNEQLNEWEVEAKEYVKRVTGIKGRFFDRSWPWIYLNVAPKVKENE